MLLPLRVMNRHHFNLVGFQKCWISNLTIRFDQFYDHERDHCVFDEVLTQRSRSASPKVMKLAPSRSQNRKILIIMVPWAPQSGAAHCPWKDFVDVPLLEGMLTSVQMEDCLVQTLLHHEIVILRGDHIF